MRDTNSTRTSPPKGGHKYLTIAHAWGRIPRNPKQRLWHKRSNPRKTLGRVNDTLYNMHGLTLHATKGWRRPSVKRGIAQTIAAAMKNGAKMDLASIREDLVTA